VAVGVEPGERAFFVDAHEPAVTGDIPRQNGRKSPLDTGHKSRPAARDPNRVYGWDHCLSIQDNDVRVGSSREVAVVRESLLASIGR
jgi:hypothetical protein